MHCSIADQQSWEGLLLAYGAPRVGNGQGICQRKLQEGSQAGTRNLSLKQ